LDFFNLKPQPQPQPQRRNEKKEGGNWGNQKKKSIVRFVATNQVGHRTDRNIFEKHGNDGNDGNDGTMNTPSSVVQKKKKKEDGVYRVRHGEAYDLNQTVDAMTDQSWLWVVGWEFVLFPP
jgi:hypothetical protein